MKEAAATTHYGFDPAVPVVWGDACAIHNLYNCIPVGQHLNARIARDAIDVVCPAWTVQYSRLKGEKQTYRGVKSFIANQLNKYLFATIGKRKPRHAR